MPEKDRVRRIVILVSFANLAGAQIAALRLARGLRDKGYDPSVHFLYEQVPVDTPDHPYEVLLPTENPGVLGYLRIAVALVGLLAREKPDAVVTFLPLANVLGQALAALLGVKRRIVSHRMPADTAKPVLRKLDTLWARLGVYTRVVAVSNGVLRTVQHYPKRLLARTEVIHNGLRGFKPSALSRSAAREKLGIRGNETVLVAVGRFVPQKNYPFLFEVVRRLDGVILLVAGDGHLRGDLERRIGRAGLGGRVRLLGNVARPDIPDLLAAADLFVQTSSFEGQSNSVLEALNAGLPLVVHDVPEQRETVADESGAVAGALVPLEDLDAWVAAIEGFRNDPERLEEARAQARRRAKAFTYEAMIDKFEKAIAA